MENKGFFASLFDFSFDNFVFPKIIKFLYALAVVVVAIAYLGAIVYGFKLGSMEGLGAVVLGPIAALFYLIMIRVWMEVAIVLFRIYENTDKIAGE